MNSEELAHEVAEAVEESHVSPVDMSVDWSEHMGVVVHYRGRSVISDVRSIMERDEVHVSEIEPDHFGYVAVEMRVPQDM